jgi:hypothetical protein
VKLLIYECCYFTDLNRFSRSSPVVLKSFEELLRDFEDFIRSSQGVLREFR